MIRGCGARVQNGLYLTVATSLFGAQELSHFLIDPVIKWEGGTLRAPMLIPDPTGTTHVLIGIGKRSYPYFPDFFEEARRYGVSKRIPLDFDPSRLTRGKSKFLLMHPRAIPGFSWEADRDYTKDHCKHPEEVKTKHPCVGGLWPLSALGQDGKQHEVAEWNQLFAKVKTPSVEYRVRLPNYPRFESEKKTALAYGAGIALGFAAFGFEYVNKKNEVPKEVAERFESKWPLEVVPE